MPTSYDLILADPPWQYRNVKTGGSHTSGAAQKYPTLALWDLEILPIPRLAAKDCILALWATVPLGKDPYQLMESWGFAYKTELFWHKVGRKGTGYWLRGEVEKLLIGIRGTVPAWRHNAPNWIEADGEPLSGLAATPSRVHSRKPGEIRDLLTGLTPGARRVELFATEYAVGWDSYGLDLGHDFRDPAFWTGLLPVAV